MLLFSEDKLLQCDTLLKSYLKRPSNNNLYLLCQVILLEGLQKGLYGMAGKIQNHLYLLRGVRERLLREELIILIEDTDTVSGNVLSSGTTTSILNVKTVPLWRELDDWVAKGGDICTNSLSLVMMQNQNQNQNQNLQQSSGSQGGVGYGRMKGSTSTSTAQGRQKLRGRAGARREDGQASSGWSGRQDEVEEREMERDEDEVEEEEEEEEEREGDDSITDGVDDNPEDLHNRSNKRQLKKISRAFEIPESVFTDMCLTATESNKPPPPVSTDKRTRAPVKNTDGTCLRTFFLPYDLSKVVQSCLLVGGTDAFMATTGRVWAIIFFVSYFFSVLKGLGNVFSLQLRTN